MAPPDSSQSNATRKNDLKTKFFSRKATVFKDLEISQPLNVEKKNEDTKNMAKQLV